MELRGGVHCLRYDPAWPARRSSRRTRTEQEILDHEAQEIYKKHKIQESIFRVEEMSEEDKHEVKLCLLKMANATAARGIVMQPNTKNERNRRKQKLPLQHGWY